MFHTVIVSFGALLIQLFFAMLGGFRALPRDLENQAFIDGASMFSSFKNVIMPLYKMIYFYFSYCAVPPNLIITNAKTRIISKSTVAAAYE